MKYTKEYLKGNKIAIRCENTNEANSVFLLFKGHDCDWNHENTCFYPDDACGAIFFREVDCESDGLNIISYSEFIKDSRKIIGYRCPFDMYRGSIKKDSIFKQSANYDYWDVSSIEHSIQFPAEIVETWEPVYEEVKPCFSDYDDLFKYFKGNKITFEEGKLITVYDPGVLVGTGRTQFVVTKKDYDFTPEFEQKLKDMGINV